MAMGGLQNKVILIAMAVLAVASLTEAQSGIPSCASKLVPCYSFINSTTKPDTTCCNSIKDAVTNELSCLCTLYNTPGVLAAFNVSVADALRIAGDCNVPATLNNCNGTAQSPASAPPPPGTPGNDSNDAAGRVAWTGIFSLCLFWAASVMLY